MFSKTRSGETSRGKFRMVRAVLLDAPEPLPISITLPLYTFLWKVPLTFPSFSLGSLLVYIGLYWFVLGSHGRGTLGSPRDPMGGEPLGAQRIPWEGTLGSPRDPWEGTQGAQGIHGRGPLGAQGIPWEGTLGSPRDPMGGDPWEPNGSHRRGTFGPHYLVPTAWYQILGTIQ